MLIHLSSGSVAPHEWSQLSQLRMNGLSLAVLLNRVCIALTTNSSAAPTWHGRSPTSSGTLPARPSLQPWCHEVVRMRLTLRPFAYHHLLHGAVTCLQCQHFAAAELFGLVDVRLTSTGLLATSSSNLASTASSRCGSMPWRIRVKSIRLSSGSVAPQDH